MRASDGAAGDELGLSVSINGASALISSWRKDVVTGNVTNVDQGQAYLYRNIHVGTGNKTEDVRLRASDGAPNDRFGLQSALGSTIAVVGSNLANIGSNIDQGAAYVFRNVHTAVGTIYESQKLISSDGGSNDRFGVKVALSNNDVAVGAVQHDIGANADACAVYIYRGINAGGGTRTQDLKLVASDGAASDQFGWGLGFSNSVALVGAPFHDTGSMSDRGAAYLYLGLSTGTGIRTEDVKIFASDGAANDRFGMSAALDGDNFVIGAHGKNSFTGKAYTGTVSSLTTLDAGNAVRYIDQISFISRGNWTIGQNTSNNTVVLTSGDSGNVTAPGSAVRVGQNNTSNNNTLTVQNNATLTATQVHVGNNVNVGNDLRNYGTITGNVTGWAGSRVRGNGTYIGNVTIQANGTIAPVPFNSEHIANLTIVGTLNMAANSRYNLQVLTDGTGSAGTHWDKITVNGSLNITATSSNPIVINLATLTTNTTFGPLATWDPNTYHVWQNIITTTGGILGFSTDRFFVDTTGFANTINSSYAFRVRQIGNNLDLEYYFVPETNTVIPALLMLAGAGLVACRRSFRLPNPKKQAGS